MKVKFSVPAGATINIHTKDGKTISTVDVKTVEIEPFFSLFNGSGEVLKGESCNQAGAIMDRFILVAAGTNGRVKRLSTSGEKAVIPLCDRPKKTRAPRTVAHE